jgi:hypothetical protein
VDGIAQTREHRAEPKSESRGRDEPSRADPFASECAWYLKQDVRNVEDRKDCVVIIALEIEILFEASKSSIATEKASVPVGKSYQSAYMFARSIKPEKVSTGQEHS